jgi:hypothetical protein
LQRLQRPLEVLDRTRYVLIEDESQVRRVLNNRLPQRGTFRRQQLNEANPYGRY